MKPEEQSTSVFLPQTCACPISSLTPKIASTFSLLAATNRGLSAFAFNKLNTFCKSLSRSETYSTEVIKCLSHAKFPPRGTVGLSPNPLCEPCSLNFSLKAQSWQIQAHRRLELNPKVTQRVSTETQRIKYDFIKNIQEHTRPLKSFVTTSRREGNAHPVVPTHIGSLCESLIASNFYQ